MVSSVWGAGGGGPVGLGIVVGGVVSFVWCIEYVGCRPVEDMVGNVGVALADLFPSPRYCNCHDSRSKATSLTTSQQQTRKSGLRSSWSGHYLSELAMFVIQSYLAAIISTP
jgi:hypothetical protein